MIGSNHQASPRRARWAVDGRVWDGVGDKSIPEVQTPDHTLARIVILGNLCHLGEKLALELPSAYCHTFSKPYFDNQGFYPLVLFQVSRADTVVSIAGTLSARAVFYLFWFLRLLHLAPRLISYTTGGDLEQTVRDWSSLPAQRKRLDRVLRWSDSVIVTQFESHAREAAQGLRNVVYLPNPASVGLPGKVPPNVQAFHKRFPFLIYLASGPDCGNDKNKGSENAWSALRVFTQFHPDVGVIVRQLSSIPQFVFMDMYWQVLGVPNYDSRTFWAVASAVDVVVDQFGLGITGLVSLESALLGTPVITRIDPDVEDIYGEPCPMFKAASGEEIVTQLEYIYSMPKSAIAARCAQAKSWVERHHPPDQMSKVVRLIHG